MIETDKNNNTTFVKEGYMQTKLGCFPEDWSIKSLDELGEFSKGKGIAKKDILEDEIDGFPCVRYAEIYTIYHYNATSLKSKINQESAENSNPINYGDILFAGSGETLKDIGKSIAYLGKQTAYAGGDIIVLKQDSQDSKYLGYLFNNDVVKNQLFKIGQGHSVVHIYSSGLKKVLVPLPPLPEQQKIASILNTWDKAIAAQEKLITQKQELKKGLMQQLFTGKKRFPGFTEEWEQVLVGEIASIKTGDSDTQDKITNGKYPFFVRSNTIERINSYSFDGEAVLTSGDGVGVGKIYHYLNEKFDYHQRVYNIHNFKPYVNGKFFFYFFSQNFYRRVVAMSAKNSVDSVRMDMIAKMPFSVPPIKEQEKIASSLSLLDDEISRIKQTESNLKQQKQGLMQQLLTGKKRVKI